ncbi:glycosyltransferase [Ferrovum myxofaciens]|uniref:glycosyltransferase n=1 Tax=Ferrovum myxofaciens TaxID=416213 RepID=UPI003EBB6B79
MGGGTAERTYQLVKALRRANIDCTVLCTDHGLGQKRRSELHDVELVAVPVLFERFLVPKISLSRLATLVRHADVIHVTGHWSVLGAMTCLMAKRLQRPYVYCPAGSLRIFGRSSTLKRLYNLICGKRIVLNADQCLAITELEREQFHEYGIPNSRISLLPNGVHSPENTYLGDSTRFRKKFGLESNNLILLFLGRLSPIKGPDLLLSAFKEISARYPQSHLVFAGPDAELGKVLHQQMKELNLEHRVHFTGFLSGQDKQDALFAANLLVVPSRREAMSLVALEAGLCGTPVLLTDQCGFDAVQTVDGGMVVPVNVEHIAQAIMLLLDDLTELRHKGLRLRDLVKTHYTWDSLTQQLLQLYKNLLTL